MKSLDLFKLDGKTAVVTGGCGKLGYWWTKALLEAGALTAVLDLPSVSPLVKLKALQKRYREKKLKFFQADVTSVRSLTKTRRKIHQQLGKCEILVNNAGIDVPPKRGDKKIKSLKQLEEIAVKMWKVNVQGIINCIEVFGQDMLAEKNGSIINIGSLYATAAPDYRLYTHLNFDKPWPYGATKAAVVQLTKHYATRWAKYGIRVNCLSPGGVIGEQDKIFIERYSVRVPLGRMVQKEKDLAGPLIFLASDASSYVTGVNLQVNGGYTAW